jgi:hypothetical protein
LPAEIQQQQSQQVEVITRNMKLIKILLFIVINTSSTIYAQENKRIYLEGDMVKIPVDLINDWPFINGEINGVKGCWMFDTGNSKAFSVHSKKVIGVESKVLGSGFVASGQKYEVLEYPLIEQVQGWN